MTDFYLGRLFDSKTTKLTKTDLNYDSADLTTPCGCDRYDRLWQDRLVHCVA